MYTESEAYFTKDVITSNRNENSRGQACGL